MSTGDQLRRARLGAAKYARMTAEDVAELGFVETSAKQDGRNMTMVLAPHRNKPRGVKVERAAEPAHAAEPAD